MSFVATHYPALIVVIPLLMSVVVALLPSAGLAWLLTLVAVTASFATALFNMDQIAAGAASYHLGGWPPPWGIEFIADGASMLVATVVTGLSFASTLYAKALIENEIDEDVIPRFYAAWLLAIGGLLGLVMTGDAFNLFVFLEISALAAVTLVAMGGNQDRRALIAAYNYLVIGAIGATFYVIGVGFSYAVTGTLNMADLAIRLPQAEAETAVFVAFAFMIGGILVKAAVFPVHIWLPAAYGYAPSAVSTLLAAVATKAAIYVLARVLFTVFAGYEATSELVLTWVVMPLSIAAIFVGTILAIRENDLKVLLAQSSIAQIGYITLGFSLATANGVAAGFVHIANHALIKGGLFMAVGALALAVSGRVTVNSLKGLGRAMPITSTALLICGLSLIGLPLTAGFISKVYLVMALVSSSLWLVTGLVLISSALSVVYLWRIVEAMWMQPRPGGGKIAENPAVYLPLWLIALANIYFGLDARAVVDASFAAAASLGVGGS